jgi:hypothetical protein
MSEETGKAKEIAPEVKPVELSEEALEQVAGGTSNLNQDQAAHKGVQGLTGSSSS